MQLSKSGQVVIVDDSYDEVQSLMLALSRQNVPFQYFNGAMDELPDTPPEGVRFVFLDIVLQGTETLDEKGKASVLTGVLQKIISKSNGPYVIVFWTGHNEIIDRVIQNCQSILISPVTYIDLEKPQCSRKDGTYDIQIITEKLKEKLSAIGAFVLYVEWENVLNASGKQFIQEFSSLVDKDTAWSKNTSSLFYKLYKSAVDKNELSEQIDQFKCACHIMNQSFLDTLQASAAKHLTLPDGFKLAHGKIDRRTTSKLNTSLFIGAALMPHPSTGDVHLEESEELKNSLTSILFKQGKTPSKRALCKIVLTPECDIAQNKTLKMKIVKNNGKKGEYKMHRIIYGLLFPSAEDPKKMLNEKGKDAQFNVGPIWHDNKVQHLWVHFSTIAFQCEAWLSGDPIFALKRELMFDLQSKAANHVNRLGNFQLS